MCLIIGFSVFPSVMFPALLPFSPYSVASFNARSINALASLIASTLLTFMTRFPAKRAQSISISAATMTTSACLISCSLRTFSAPMDPCVSTRTESPRFFPACSRDSAAMYVCAIPAAHAVIATICLLISFPPIKFSYSISCTFFNVNTYSPFRVQYPFFLN